MGTRQCGSSLCASGGLVLAEISVDVISGEIDVVVWRRMRHVQKNISTLITGATSIDQAMENLKCLKVLPKLTVSTASMWQCDVPAKSTCISRWPRTRRRGGLTGFGCCLQPAVMAKIELLLADRAPTLPTKLQGSCVTVTAGRAMYHAVLKICIKAPH
jgi:hypothetical protein